MRPDAGRGIIAGMTAYADLHCHPTLYGFNRIRNGPHDEDPARYTPWYVPDDVSAENMARGVRAATYTQASLPMLWESGTRLAYASLTPVEKGFFVGSETGAETSFSVEILRFATGQTILSSAGKLLRGDRYGAGASVTRILRNRGPARKALQRAFLRYSAERVHHMQSHRLDYWDEFLRELAYVRAHDGRTGRGMLTRPDGWRAEVEGRYHLVKGRAHLDEVLGTARDVALLLTIEGAHTFSIGPDGRRVDEATLFDRIETLKSLPEVISFITLAHHFDNGLCGHAHSLPDAASWVMDQSARMGEDLTPMGMRVVRELLDLDENLRPRGGRRILIDFKHMSARARRTYYTDIVYPYNRWARAQGAPPIPVVTSHSAYSGVATLEELDKNRHREDDFWHSPPFLRWSINHCDEDVRAVFDSGGLIGFVFDQRVTGLVPRQRLPRESWIELFVRQLFGSVDVILQDERIPPAQRLAVWDCVCLGTDFDGLIDPFTPYPTVLHLDSFADDLREQLQRHRHTRGIAEIGVDRLAEKILWQNAVDFARRTLMH